MTTVRGERCTAKANRTGERCKLLVRGGGVCPKHGGSAPAVKRRRLERVAIAEALAADPRRSPDEVLGDVLHQADWLMRQARTEVDANQPTAQTMTKLMDLTERAGNWARTAISADVDQRQARVSEAQAAVLVTVVRRVLGRLDLSDVQQALVSTVVPEEFDRAQLEAGGRS